MSWLTTIPIIGEVFKKLFDVIGEVIEDKDEANRIRADLTKLINGIEMDKFAAQLASQTKVIVAEAQGEEFGQGDLSEPTEVIDEGTPSMQAATEDVLYVVRAGDSLGALALRFYGDADLNGAIFKANRQVLDTPESLRLGMKLLIPAKSGL